MYNYLMDLQDFSLVPETDPILHQRVPEFTDFGPVADNLCNVLWQAMKHFNGAGISANQIGLSARAFVAQIGDQPFVAFNPIVTMMDGKEIKLEEGCLSFPGISLDVTRPASCQLTFQDTQGKHHKREFIGFDARCVMHETDHLNGITFTKRVSKLHLSMRRRKSKKAR